MTRGDITSNSLKEPLSPAEATEVIKGIARIGSVGTTDHCREDSMSNRGITYQDLLSILQNGGVREWPEYEEKHRQYKYKVEGTSIDDESTVAVTVILSHLSVLGVTVF